MREAIVGYAEVAREAHATMRLHGLRGRPIHVAGCIGYEYTLPLTDGRTLRARSVVHLGDEDDQDNSDEVSGFRSRRRRRKARRRVRRAKRRAKIKAWGKRAGRRFRKVVKSRAFGAIMKAAKAVATVIPGGAAIVTAATVAEKAARAIKRAKQLARNRKALGRGVLRAALREGANQIRAARA